MKQLRLLGPESTGKSELANQLAKRFNAVHVAEYARVYFQTHSIDRYTVKDVVSIYEHQKKLEQEAASLKPPLLIIDSSFITASIWCEEVFDEIPAFIQSETKNETAHLYLLTDIDLPWVADEQRKNRHNRAYLLNRFIRKLKQNQAAYCLISGRGKARYQMAAKALQDMLG